MSTEVDTTIQNNGLQAAGRIPVKTSRDQETAFSALDIRSLTRRIAPGSVDSEPKRRLLLLPQRRVCDTSEDRDSCFPPFSARLRAL
jgi:hypothetical protein